MDQTRNPGTYGFQVDARWIYLRGDVMSVQKRGSGYATVHCHGKNKGKVIHKFKTKKEAEAQHRAIQAHKHPKKSRTYLGGRKK